MVCLLHQHHFSTWTGCFAGLLVTGGLRLWHWAVQLPSPSELRRKSQSEISVTLLHLADGLESTGPNRISRFMQCSLFCVKFALMLEVSKYSVNC